MKRLSLVGLSLAALCLMIVGTALAKRPTNLTLKTAKGAITTGRAGSRPKART